MIAPAIVKFNASFVVSIIHTLSDSPANNRWEIEENIAIPTPRANPTPAPSNHQLEIQGFQAEQILQQLGQRKPGNRFAQESTKESLS